jgi:hypothetical protein
MTGSRRHRLTKGTGALLGASLAALALQGWQVAGGSGHLPAGVVLEVNRTGELDVAPLGRFLATSGLRPGSRPAQDSFVLRNRTLRPLRVQLRALPSLPGLDGLLELRVTAGGHDLFEGDLRGLRRWTRARLRLSAAEARRVAVRVWLPRGVSGYEGRRAAIELDLRALEAL